jgi:2-oxoglutarate ferredoxin oxidoreductase subunit gamma
MKEIRFAGFGGQGIIRAGLIMGKAVSLYDHRHSTMNQSFGPEARGGACSSTLLISDKRILYPYLTKTDIFVAMSEEAYQSFKGELRPDGLLIYDSDLVNPPEKVNLFPIPATRFAEELGNRIFANLVILGFITAVTNIVSVGAMKQAIPESVPERYIGVNIKAFERGYEYGKKTLTVSGEAEDDVRIKLTDAKRTMLGTGRK